MLHRNLQSALIDWHQKPGRKPLLLKGVRQVGKTYLLKHFGEQYFPNSYYINFENDLHLHKLFDQNLDPTRILRELSFEFGQDIDVNHDFLIFDEIQACPPALTSLKYFNEQCPQLALGAAGSLLGVHLNQNAFPVGKVDMLTLHPLSFVEFLQAADLQPLLDLLSNHDWLTPLPQIAHQRLWQHWKTYLVVGGMPEVMASYLAYKQTPVASMQAVRVKQNELIRAYNADVAKHAGKENAMHIARVWEHVAIQLSSTKNEQADRFRFKDVVPGADRYQRLVGAIDWLGAADLIIKIPIAHTVELPLKAHTKESLFKLFYGDVGLLGARCGLPPDVILQDEYGGYKGYFAENFVAQALQSNDIHDLSQLYSWQDKKAEVEFLQTTNQGIIPIEVKSGTNVGARSLEKLCQRYNPSYAVILSANNISYDSDKNIKHYPLYLAELQPWLFD